jgi:hypothetical protein
MSRSWSAAPTGTARPAATGTWPAGRPRVLPGWQERRTADRVRAAHRPRWTPGRGPGLPRQHRRPGRVHRHHRRGPGQVRAGADGHGRGPGDDHQRPDRRAEPGRRRDTAGGPLPVDHRAARPRDPQADGRRRPAPAVPVRSAGPGSTCSAPPCPPPRWTRPPWSPPTRTKFAERDFRHIKSDDLDLPPVFCRLEERVRAHVLICMLA